MNLLDFIGGPIVGKILDKLFPDPIAKGQAQLALFQAQQAGEFKELDFQAEIAKGQTDVNLEEAKSASLFKGGWRPLIGWICGAGLAYDFLAQPLLSWASTAYWHVYMPPQLDVGTLMVLITGMLGLGGMRTAERINGVIPPSK